jgi:hypothetical protein
MRAVHGAYPAGRLRRSCVAPARTSHWRDLPLADRKRQCSPSADGVDDFDAIAFGEQVCGVFGARHDASIDLDRDAALRVADVFEQFRYAAGCDAIVRLAIE